MPTTYKAFKQITTGQSPQHLPNYYQLLIQHRQAIARDVLERNQKIVAKELGMSASSFSAVFKLLIALDQTQTKTA